MLLCILFILSVLCYIQLGPNVYVGAGVVIGAGARVREAIVLDRAVIQVKP